jgi:NADP-dependent 3-hydroxy acid dehydrogenase YdfG
MSARLEGTAALITGASSGIGAATARRLAEEGAAVALVARRKDRLDELAEEIRKTGGHAIAIESDVTDKVQAKAAVEQTVSELGRLDILINNAGVMLLGAIEQAPLEEWDQMVQVNVMGVLYTAHAAIPHLLKAAQDDPRRVADIVNVSSTSGRISRNGTGVYATTKFGVVAFSESLRQEFTKPHLRVGVIEPGVVATELPTHMREEVRQQAMQRFSGYELLEAEDIADSIAYIVTRPRRMSINELLVRPTEQEA